MIIGGLIPGSDSGKIAFSEAKADGNFNRGLRLSLAQNRLPESRVFLFLFWRTKKESKIKND